MCSLARHANTPSYIFHLIQGLERQERNLSRHVTSCQATCMITTRDVGDDPQNKISVNSYIRQKTSHNLNKHTSKLDCCVNSSNYHQDCKYSTSQNTRITIGLGSLTNTFASADETTGHALTARTGLALCPMPSCLGIGGHRRAHWWVPARTPTVHQCLYGGRPWGARDTLHATPPRRQNQGYRDTPWLPTL